MTKQKLNGYAKWILVIITLSTIIYNSIVTHTIVRNDVKHLQETVSELKQDVRDLTNYLLKK